MTQRKQLVDILSAALTAVDGPTAPDTLFFERFDARSGEQHHLKTGPTGTNVMDLQIMVVEAT